MQPGGRSCGKILVVMETTHCLCSKITWGQICCLLITGCLTLSNICGLKARHRKLSLA